ncbi:MAG: DNA polymerase III subunit delta' [Brachymonas sp.]|nr:DNA polymerase III subunit delta' [Brachymonas sp.]
MSEAVVADSQSELPHWLAAQRNQLLASPAHALLLHGASGLGQYELALSIAQSWLCEAADLPERLATGEGACGQCASCQQIRARSHTDLLVLMPETVMLALGWPLSEKAQSDIDGKKRKPSKDIRIDDVREAVAFAELTSGRGRGKAILVYPAEQLNLASANALLKTLEEPQGGLRFVLATEAAHQLLPTIRSRCQAFALTAPSQAQAIQWLTQQTQATAPELEMALHASGQRPGDALALVQSGLAVQWHKLPLALHKGQMQAVAQWSPAQLLDAMHKLCHDLWASKLGAAPRFSKSKIYPKPRPPRALTAWSKQLVSLSRQIEHPFKPDLLIEDMVNQAKLCLNSRV